jgi:hypothetical protein
LTVKRMDNVGIVVEDIGAAIEFFTELGLTLEGRMPIEGEWAGRVTGVRGQRVEIAMMRTPGSASSVRRWSMKSSITKTFTGCATSGVLKEFSSGSPSSSGSRPPERIPWNANVENSALGDAE